MVSSLQAFKPDCCTHFSSRPYVLHDPSITYSVTWSPHCNLEKIASSEIPSHPFGSSSPHGPNILLSTPFSVTLHLRPCRSSAVRRWLPTAAARVRVRAACGGLWWTRRHWGRFSPSTSVSPANHSTDFSIIIITRGWHKRPISGRSVEWTLIPPPTMQIKKLKKIPFI
jgi:hypothetical protein